MKTALLRILMLSAAVSVACGIAASQQKHCFMVGISDYGNANEWGNISGANDVRLLAPMLAAQGFSVDTLTDAMATKKNIIEGAWAAGRGLQVRRHRVRALLVPRPAV